MKNSIKNYVSITIDIDTLGEDFSTGNLSKNDSEKIRRLAYNKSLPRILDILQGLGIKATFFIIGKDGLIHSNKRVIRDIASRGHEIANHSLAHRRDLVKLNKNEIIEDISLSGKILSDITGDKLYGFRMPGCTINNTILNALEGMGYIYDSSLNSSIAYNLAKLLYKGLFAKGNIPAPSQGISSLRAPGEPYFPDKKNIFTSSNNNSGILEIPITLVPWLSIPFMNYLLLTGGYRITELFYRLIRRKRKFLNFVMHDSELACFDDYQGQHLSCRLCGWHLNKDIRLREGFVNKILKMISLDYQFITLKEYAMISKGINSDPAR
ncbi:MAG: polysaccharide deacetylase family protein [Candidatus Omnitrophica bacterium]|nr:polysaccharide deacetylase family protein [Candidatus Omnitrophota bacterium]MDD5690546.1 polysaccharide deacetylase family protein [Candidatus Omnitrophota bacterium]